MTVHDGGESWFGVVVLGVLLVGAIMAALLILVFGL